MASRSPDGRLRHMPWVAVTGELSTAACFGLLALFFPPAYWVTWPQLLLSCHFGAAISAAVMLAWALFRRRPGALKAAIVLAAFVGLPGPLFIAQALGEIHAAGDSRTMMFTYAVWGLGSLGQAAVLFPCLRRLAPTLLPEARKPKGSQLLGWPPAQPHDQVQSMPPDDHIALPPDDRGEERGTA